MEDTNDTSDVSTCAKCVLYLSVVVPAFTYCRLQFLFALCGVFKKI